MMHDYVVVFQNNDSLIGFNSLNEADHYARLNAGKVIRVKDWHTIAVYYEEV